MLVNNGHHSVDAARLQFDQKWTDMFSSKLQMLRYRFLFRLFEFPLNSP